MIKSTAYWLIFRQNSMIFKGSPNSLTESYFTGKLRMGKIYLFILFIHLSIFVAYTKFLFSVNFLLVSLRCAYMCVCLCVSKMIIVIGNNHIIEAKNKFNLFNISHYPHYRRKFLLRWSFDIPPIKCWWVFWSRHYTIHLNEINYSELKYVGNCTFQLIDNIYFICFG